MNAREKTDKLVREEIPVELLIKNEANPNKMSSRAFDLLIDNMQRTGITDPILVRPVDMEAAIKLYDSTDENVEFTNPDTGEELKFRIVGGHHRYDGAIYLGFETVPCTVILDPEFDEEQETFQIVRMNVIHGKLDPQAFFNLYQKYADKYGDAILQDSFGFADEAEWNRLVNQAAKQLPDKDTQKKFKEAAQQVKTIDGLAALLNKMFTMYGDTLPYGYMVFDQGGQRNLWLRSTKKTMKAAETLGGLCIEKEVTMDDIVGLLLEHALGKDGKELLEGLFDKAPKVDIPGNMIGVPTKDKIEGAQQFNGM